MKKIIMIATAGCFLGIALIVISFLVAGGSFKGYNSVKASDFERMEYVCQNEITELDLEDANTQLVIKTGDVKKATIVYYNSKNEKYSVTEDDGILRMEKSDGKISLVNFGLDDDEIQTEITLPKSFHGKFSARNSSGRMEISDIEATSIVIENCSGESLIKNISADDTIDISNLSGSLNIMKVSGGKMEFENLSGTLKASDISSSETIIASNSSGHSSYSDISVEEGLDLSTSSGHLDAKIIGDESDFTITKDVSSGSCNVNNSNSGSKTLDIYVASGHLDIEFEEK